MKFIVCLIDGNKIKWQNNSFAWTEFLVFLVMQCSCSKLISKQVFCNLIDYEKNKACNIFYNQIFIILKLIKISGVQFERAQHELKPEFWPLVPFQICFQHTQTFNTVRHLWCQIFFIIFFIWCQSNSLDTRCRDSHLKSHEVRQWTFYHYINWIIPLLKFYWYILHES